VSIQTVSTNYVAFETSRKGLKTLAALFPARWVNPGSSSQHPFFQSGWRIQADEASWWGFRGKIKTAEIAVSGTACRILTDTP
jgi:hypothetical protein